MRVVACARGLCGGAMASRQDARSHRRSLHPKNSQLRRIVIPLRWGQPRAHLSLLQCSNRSHRQPISVRLDRNHRTSSRHGWHLHLTLSFSASTPRQTLSHARARGAGSVVRACISRSSHHNSLSAARASPRWCRRARRPAGIRAAPSCPSHRCQRYPRSRQSSSASAGRSQHPSRGGGS